MGIAQPKEIAELDGLITRWNVGTGFYQLTSDGEQELQRYQSALSLADTEPTK
jgi:DNA-binding PadR family transcriptional regulator